MVAFIYDDRLNKLDTAWLIFKKLILAFYKQLRKIVVLLLQI